MSPEIVPNDLQECAEALEWGSYVAAKCPEPWRGEPRKRRSGGYVYFIGGDCDCVKIGWTREDPKRRLRALQTGAPVKLFLLAWTPAEPHFEREYHTQFKDDWSHGEWFRKSPRLLKLIDALNQRNNHERNMRGLPNE